MVPPSERFTCSPLRGLRRNISLLPLRYTIRAAFVVPCFSSDTESLPLLLLFCSFQCTIKLGCSLVFSLAFFFLIVAFHILILISTLFLRRCRVIHFIFIYFSLPTKKLGLLLDLVVLSLAQWSGFPCFFPGSNFHNNNGSSRCRLQQDARLCQRLKTPIM